MITSRRKRWTGSVERMVEKRNTYRVWREILNGKGAGKAWTWRGKNITMGLKIHTT